MDICNCAAGGATGGTPGAIKGATTGWKIGQATSVIPIQIANLVATFATFAGVSADIYDGSTNAYFEISQTSAGIQISEGLSMSSNTLTSNALTRIGWVPMPVELSWAMQAAAVGNDLGLLPVSIPGFTASTSVTVP